MTETQENLETMKIELVWDPSNRSGKPYALQKVGGLGRWILHFDVGPEGQVVQVILNRNEDPLPRPCHLQFYCSFDPIIGMGFSECKKGIEKYTLAGPCGGCFSLHEDIPPEGSKSVIVENYGHQREDGEHYYFGLWLKTFGPVHAHVFDPEIYNDGSIHEPPPDPEEKGDG